MKKRQPEGTRFFVDFFQLSMLCDYNDRVLLQEAYSMLLKRVKDEMTNFDCPSTLQDLRDLVLKINQRYWECKAKITHENGPAPWTDKRPGNKSPKPESTIDTSGSKDKKKPKELTQKKLDLINQLGKDSKLTPQEYQWHMDGGLCLLYASNSHMIKDCPKSTWGRAAQATNTMDESTADASEAKKLVSYPETSTCAGGCIDSVHMQVEVKLNTNSISLSTSLILNIASKSFLHVSEKALVDSGSTHCFLDHSLIWSLNSHLLY